MKHNFKDILHNVNLTEGQISTILFVLEGYINPTENNSYDPDCREDIDKIFEELQGAVDRFYDNMEKKQEQQPVAEWTD